MTAYLPKDIDNAAIPAVRLKPSGAQTISTVTASSTRTGTAFHAKTEIVSLYATEDMYVNFGDDTVTAAATDHFFPKGIYYDFAIGGDKVDQYSHVAARAASTAGTLYISEKE
jgi:hypothetical protein